MSHSQQKLFNHMKDEHGLTLLEGEMFAIEDIVTEMHGFDTLEKELKLMTEDRDCAVQAYEDEKRFLEEKIGGLEKEIEVLMG